MREIPVTMKRCVKCILPETFPGIKFNVEGVCNYCLSQRKVVVNGEDALKKLLEQYRSKGEKYDCVVPISGGRDSAFVLHQMVRKYKIRTIALTVDSGFIMPEGVRNIERMTEVLNVDHVMLRNEKRIEFARQNVRKRFHAWLKMPSINTIVPVLNSGDKTMNLQIYRFAGKNKIPVVIGGNNVGNTSFEFEHFKTGFLGVFPDDQWRLSPYNKIKLLFLFGLEYFKNPRNYHKSILKEYIQGMPAFFFEPLFTPKDVVPVFFYDHIHWNEKEILSTITKELDWRGASDTTATWRIDDAAYPLIDYLYYRLVGFTEFDEMYSKMIRDGQISRDEALKRCISDNAPRVSRLKKACEELDVSLEYVNEVLDRYREELLSKILNWKT